MRSLISLAILVASSALSAQSVVSISPQKCVWRAGDDRAWSSPNLDESGWLPYSEWKPAPGQPLFWVRCHADISSLKQLEHPAIQVRLHAAYQIYFNGSLIGNSGNLSNGNFTLDGIRAYPISASLLSSPTTSISLRLRFRDLTSVSAPVVVLLLTRLELFAGAEQILDALRAQTIMRRSSQYLAIAICYGIVGVIAIMLLGLFFYDRSRFEILYLGVACLIVTLARESEVCVVTFLNYPFSLELVVAVLTTFSGLAAQLLFFFTLARRRVPLPFWILLAALIFFIFPEALDALMVNLQSPWLDSQHRVLLRTLQLASLLGLTLAPFFAFWPIARVARRMRPLAGLCLVLGASQFAYYVTTLTAMRLPGVPDLFAHWGLTIIEVRAFTTAGVLIGLLILLLREHRQVSLDRAQLAGEMQAARSVQRYLIPDHLPPTPGLSIQSEYRPAREVGGDFFQVLPQTADGSLLIVIGDVSGKGVEAGMLATLIVGAIRTAAVFTADPERILALLNERLRGRGLVTCLALHIEHDGGANLVNAGHLPPYFNGKELVVEGSLPLGAAPGISFPVTQFQLAEGDSLILMTDGVAEAQNAQGHLFGFQRIAELLGKGAGGAALADAAQNFGQQDDITVLTITRLATGKESTREISAQILAQA
jgi:hypothetical protein